MISQKINTPARANHPSTSTSYQNNPYRYHQPNYRHTAKNTYKTLNYYSPRNAHLHVRTHQYETQRGQKECQTFRKKKETACKDLMYTSCLNPFSRNKEAIRYDQSYKETYERKKAVPQVSNCPTDPLTLRYEPPRYVPRVRGQFQSSAILQLQNEKKSLLPAQRQFSNNHKRYHVQFGFSHSLEKEPRRRERINSSVEMRPILEYKEARHHVQTCTPKIGSRLKY